MNSYKGMQFFRVLPLFFASIAVLALTACPDKKIRVQKPDGIRRVKGDPMNFVKGTQMNGSQPLPAQLFTHGSFWFVGISGYVEGEAQESTLEQEEINQAPTQISTQNQKNARKKSAGSFQVKNSGNQVTFYGDQSVENLRLNFENRGSGFEFVSALSEGDNFIAGTNIDVLHTSYRQDFSAFSVLFYSKLPHFKGLVSLTFIRGNVMNAPERAGNQIYQYMFGPGKLVGWPKSEVLTVSVCPGVPEPMVKLLAKSTNTWAEVLVGKLQMRTIRSSACPPFSDINTKMIYLVPGWIEFVGTLGEFGTTRSIINRDRNQLLDSDIFILAEEMNEAIRASGSSQSILDQEILSNPSVRKILLSTFIHEFGHLLGLHHQPNRKYPSIMSYDENIQPKLYDYDIKAIQHLYE